MPIGELHNKIKELLDTYTGGEQYFDALDNYIRNSQIPIYLYNTVKYLYPNHKIIASGKFAQVIPCDIKVQGAIRKGNKINLNHNEVHSQNFIFIDDSFYSGKTAFSIQREIEKLGGKLHKIFVVYNGCKYKNDKVISLFNYYENNY